MHITLDANSARRIDQNGFMHVATSNISKEAVNPYLGSEIPHYEALGLEANKIYQVYRKGTELAKGAKTFANMPLLRNHHEDSAKNPQREHRVGSLGSDPVFCAPYLQCSLCITDSEAIEKIQNGQRVELSAAYFYTPVLASGVFEGQPYDIIMADIRANHVALVEEGRAGPDVLVADSGKNNKQEGFMDKLKEAFARFRAVFNETKNDAKDKAEMDAIAKAEADLARVEAAIGGVGNATEEASVADCDIMGKVMDILAEKLDADSLEKFKLLLANNATPTGDGDGGPEQCANETSPKSAPERAETAKKTPPTQSPAQDARPFAPFDVNAFKRQLTQEFLAKNEAVREVQVLVGDMDPLAFDSADDIYLHACELRGARATRHSARDVFSSLKMNATQNFAQSVGHATPITTDSSQKSRFKGAR